MGPLLRLRQDEIWRRLKRAWRARQSGEAGDGGPLEARDLAIEVKNLPLRKRVFEDVAAVRVGARSIAAQGRAKRDYRLNMIFADLGFRRKSAMKTALSCDTDFAGF
jgi:hypothetical protein